MIGRTAFVTAVGVGALASGMSGAARAADMPVKAAPRVAAATVANWTGFYAGIHGGYGWGSADYDFPGDIGLGGIGGFNGAFSPTVGGNFSQRIAGGVFGGHAGYNQQFGNAVLGLEASGSWSGLKGTALNPFALGADRTYKTKLEWFATLTSRLGYASDNWLFYGKAGLAAGQVVSDLIQATPFRTFDERNGHVGWTVGAGIEHMWAPHWIIGLEYNYVDLGQEQYGGVARGSLARGQYDVELSYHTVLARLSYKADAPAATAVVAGTPVKARPAVTAGPWSGFYAGVHGGYGWGDADHVYPPNGSSGEISPAAGGAFTQSIDGRIAGAHVGANQQIGSVVLGVEGSFARSGIEGSSQDVFPGPGARVVETETYETKLRWFATATPRVGVASGNWLYFAKGGLAVGSVRLQTTNTDPGGLLTFEEKTYHVGWTVGGGVEHAWSPNWIVGLEYSYVDLGTEKYGGHRVVNGVNQAGYESTVQLQFSTVMGRLSYKLGAAP